MSSVGFERDLDLAPDPRGVCAARRRRGRPTVFLEGVGDVEQGWTTLIGLDPRVLFTWRRGSGRPPGAALDRLDRIVRARRAHGGASGTGVAVLLGFDLLEPLSPGAGPALPDLLVLEVDAGLRFDDGARPVLSLAATAPAREPGVEDRLRRTLEDRPLPYPEPVAASGAGEARTSLPRDDYLEAVRRIKQHIRAGDIYQANLTQQFTLPWAGDPFALYARLSNATPAPRSAFVEAGDLAVASVSPETFLRALPGGAVETRPIKGTRPRGASPAADRALARELLRSPKDRAELLMIVDLERNDLGRVCRTGSVRVTELAELRTYPAVHHLVATVTGQLRPDVGPAELLQATFPGGSVTGAPKIRALEILRALEPVARNFYTGSLVWLGDDGSLESSILIRTVVLAGGRAYLGAGGGVVADSDPEGEWHESNHKARRLARVMGFDPEEAR